MIPKIVHYCFFRVSPDQGGKPWSLVHYACLKSAIENIKPFEVVFYCDDEPTGPWWERTRNMVTVERTAAPREIFGNPLRHVAHRADVLRLDKLLSKGGIYLDPDVFVHRSFDDLLTYRTVLGEQRFESGAVGLCNAVILSEPGAPFLKRWQDEYRTFRSRGRDEFWDEHSVRRPYQLSRQFPDEIKILPESAFYWPTFNTEGLRKIFAYAEPLDVSRSYATHLWEVLAWEQYLEYLVPKRVRAVETNFHRWARALIKDLPDDFAMPSLDKRLRKRLRAIKRRLGRS